MKTPEQWRALFEKQREEATKGLVQEIEAAERHDKKVYGPTGMAIYKKLSSFDKLMLKAMHADWLPLRTLHQRQGAL
jgi:hypothetical protein